MATKQFKIKYNGSDGDLELEDTPRAGIIIKVLKSALKYKAGNPLPEPDLDEYVVGLATNLLTKTPWSPNSASVIRDLPWPTYSTLCEILGNEFPLEGFLFPAGRLMYGKRLDATAESTSLTDSILSSPSSGSPSDR